MKPFFLDSYSETERFLHKVENDRRTANRRDTPANEAELTAEEDQVRGKNNWYAADIGSGMVGRRLNEHRSSGSPEEIKREDHGEPRGDVLGGANKNDHRAHDNEGMELFINFERKCGDKTFQYSAGIGPLNPLSESTTNENGIKLQCYILEEEKTDCNVTN